jgi:hypothetical protein
MKIRPFTRFSQDDYRGSPVWFWNFLGNLNLMVDTLNAALQSNLDIDNNLLAERQTVSVSHNVPVTLRMKKLTSTPRLVRLGYANGYIGTAAISKYNTDGSLQVTVYFLGTVPTSAQSVVLIFEP